MPWGNASAATNYYVDGSLGSNCTGNYSITNRSCSGSDGNAYTTVQAAVDATVAGDTVYIRAGTYVETVTTKTNGVDEAGRITIRNYGSEAVTITNFRFTRNYNTLQGVTLAGSNVELSNTIEITYNGSHSTIKDCTINNPAGRGRLIYLTYTNSTYTGYTAPSHCLIDGNIFSGLLWNSVGIMIHGNNHTITNNIFHNGYDTDAVFYIYGYNNVIADNDIHDMLDDPERGYHVDVLQTTGGPSPPHDNVFERNLVYNIEGAFAQLSGEGGLVVAKNNIFRNNIFANIWQKASISIQAHWYNNTFYRAASVVDWHILVNVRHTMDIDNISSSNPAIVTVASPGTTLIMTGASFKFEGVAGNMGTTLNGNTYETTKIDDISYSIPVDTTALTYEVSANDLVEHATAEGSNIENNIFLECGVTPSSTSQGWYSFSVPPGTLNYNYVAGTSYAAKGAAFTETNGVNGGNPYLSNEGGTTAADYALTSSSSILRDQGVDIADVADDYAGNARSSTDIGAYEYTGAADVVAPASPTGLSIQ